MNTIELKTGLELLTKTIQNDLRHKDYKRVTELADEYTSYVTGEDIEKLLIQFNPREDEMAFAQRVRITQVVTPYIANRLMTPMYKVGRTAATKNFQWSGKEKTDDMKKKLMEAIGEFFGEESLEDYLAIRMVELDSTDPNAFLVVDFEGEVNPNDEKSKADPYPFEVSSHEAIDYKYKNNKLQYLTVLNTLNDLNRYTMYLADEAIIAQQLDSEVAKNYTLEKDEQLLYKDPKAKDTTEVYVVTVVKHKAGRIPAIRVGTKRDLKTRKRTCVPFIHPARTFFKKSLKTVSEFDLSNTLHVFPKLITYSQVCPGDLANNIVCDNGKMPDNTTCPRCKGDGFLEHKSSGDVIRVRLPEDPKDMVNLENYLAYKHPPTEILEFLKKLGLYEFPELAIQAVYTSEIFIKDTVTTTATEKNIDLESVYDALKPFANQWSSVYKHMASVIASYVSVSKSLTIQHAFPKDFKMKSITMLLQDYQMANNNGAPPYIKSQINKDIAQKMYADKPDELLKIEVKERFYPFNGKTESEISNIILNDLTTKYNKILYANFDAIFDEIDLEIEDKEVSFYRMESSAQKALVKKKVDEYIQMIEDEAAESRATSFGSASNGEEGKI